MRVQVEIFWVWNTGHVTEICSNPIHPFTYTTYHPCTQLLIHQGTIHNTFYTFEEQIKKLRDIYLDQNKSIKVLAKLNEGKYESSDFILDSGIPPLNRIDLQALTLVGPTGTRLLLDLLAIFHYKDHLDLG